MNMFFYSKSYVEFFLFWNLILSILLLQCQNSFKLLKFLWQLLNHHRLWISLLGTINIFSCALLFFRSNDCCSSAPACLSFARCNPFFQRSRFSRRLWNVPVQGFLQPLDLNQHEVIEAALTHEPCSAVFGLFAIPRLGRQILRMTMILDELFEILNSEAFDLLQLQRLDDVDLEDLDLNRESTSITYFRFTTPYWGKPDCVRKRKRG